MYPVVKNWAGDAEIWNRADLYAFHVQKMERRDYGELNLHESCLIDQWENSSSITKGMEVESKLMETLDKATSPSFSINKAWKHDCYINIIEH